MTTSTGLARATAAAFGLNEKTVLLHLKHIRAVRGNITFAGHGTSAADMKSLDAARLVIATAGSAYAANAIHTLERFSRLVLLRRRGYGVILEDLLSETIDGLRSGSFRPRSMEGHYARRDVLAMACLKLTWVEGGYGDDLPRIATIRRFRPGGGHDVFTFASSSALKGPYLDEARLMDVRDDVRMTTTRSVSLHALQQVAAAL